MKRIAKDRTPLVREGPGGDFILSFKEFNCGILDGEAYTIEQYTSKKGLIRQYRHLQFFFEKQAENLKRFLQLVEEGKIERSSYVSEE